MQLRRLLVFILLAATAALAACSPPSEADIRLERSVFQQVREGRLLDVEQHLTPAAQNATTRTNLTLIQRDYIRADQPTKIELLQWTVLSDTSGSRTITCLDQYTYPDRMLVVQTTVQIPASGPYVLQNFHVRSVGAAEASTIAAAGAFTLWGRPLAQLIFFSVFILVLTLMVIAIFGVVFTKGFKRKWLWVIVALAGAPVYRMNWTTGDWAPTFSAGLIDAGIVRGPSIIDPWIVFFHVPIGALIVLFLLIRRWRGYGPDDD